MAALGFLLLAHPVTSFSSHPPPRLTVLLPAYDEALRIEDTLRAYSSYLSKSPIWGGENRTDVLLVVDDGSTDGTADVVSRFAADKCPVPVQCFSLPQNEGKGGAISQGMEELVRRRRRDRDDSNVLVLVADADGSGDVACLDRMVTTLASVIERRYGSSDEDNGNGEFWNETALVVGDRGYEGAGPARAILRWGFRTAVRLICGDMGVGDTQCGLKLMTLQTGALYRDLNLRRWTHDVEVLYRARELGVPVGECLVRWEDKDGSKLVTSPGGAVGASMGMLLAIIRMRLEYAFGRWQINEKR